MIATAEIAIALIGLLINLLVFVIFLLMAFWLHGLYKHFVVAGNSA